MWTDVWIGFFVGVFVGATLGVFGMGLLYMLRDTSYEEADLYRQIKESNRSSRNGL